MSKRIAISVNEPELAKEVANVFNRIMNRYITVDDIIEWDLTEENRRVMYSQLFEWFYQPPVDWAKRIPFELRSSNDVG